MKIRKHQYLKKSSTLEYYRERERERKRERERERERERDR